jgi:hypothetical protein
MLQHAAKVIALVFARPLVLVFIFTLTYAPGLISQEIQECVPHRSILRHERVDLSFGSFGIRRMRHGRDENQYLVNQDRYSYAGFFLFLFQMDISRPV